MISYHIPNTESGKSPADWIFKSKLRTELDFLHPEIINPKK